MAAKKDSYDVIVVGAGPGGSTTAAYLGRMGKKVLLLDKAKFPRDKTCGDALSGKSMRVIRELGLEAEVEKLPHSRIDGVYFSSPSGSAVGIPFTKNDPNRKGGKGYCMRRMHTDNMFFNAAKKTKNVKTIENFIASGAIFKDGFAVGVKGIDVGDSRKEKAFYAKVIVGADGVNSAIARSVLGKKAELDPKHSCDAVRGYYSGISGMTDKIEIHFFKSCIPGYFWIFPLEGGRANVGLGMLSGELKERMKKDKVTLISLMQDAAKNEPLLKERFKNAKLEGQITGWRLPFGSARRQLAGNGWALVGDAGSLVDPFSGEGVGNATLSGRLAAKAISGAIESGDVGIGALSLYEKELWRELSGELETSYKMQQLGKITWLLNLLVSKAQKSPELRELISASLSNEDAKRNFKNPLFYLKLILM